MKHKCSMRSWLVVSALVATGYAGIASAHTQIGVLGKRADKSDIYEITCSDDGNGPPARLEVEIEDLLPIRPPLVSVQVLKGSESVTTTDPKEGDSRPGLAVSNNGGAGAYTVTVSKLAKPGKPDRSRRYKELYSLDYHCITGSNQHTGTNTVTIQNQ
jgi:hypothetical protein